MSENQPSVGKAFLRSIKFSRSHIQHQARLLGSRIINWFKPGNYAIFVDGSYRNEVGMGFGVVVLYKGTIIQQISGNIKDFSRDQQSLGEFRAVTEGIKWCESQGARKITVFYDCEGIRCLSRKYRSSTKHQPDYTKYHQFMRPRVLGDGQCRIVLRKVKAHNCDLLNNWADRLAKMGLYEVSLEKFMEGMDLPRQTNKYLMRMMPYIAKYPLAIVE